jgi:phage terminase small subunit
MPAKIADYRKLADEHRTKVCSFYQAVNVSDEPAPKAAGEKESFVLKGLAPGKHWVAVKSLDAEQNMSELSNVVEVEVK